MLSVLRPCANDERHIRRNASPRQGAAPRPSWAAHSATLLRARARAAAGRASSDRGDKGAKAHRIKEGELDAQILEVLHVRLRPVNTGGKSRVRVLPDSSRLRRAAACPPAPPPPSNCRRKTKHTTTPPESHLVHWSLVNREGERWRDDHLVDESAELRLQGFAVRELDVQRHGDALKLRDLAAAGGGSRNDGVIVFATRVRPSANA